MPFFYLNYTELAFAALLVTCCSVCYYLYHTLTFWTRQNIPNLVLYFANSMRGVMPFNDQNCVAKYGKIIGTYALLRPVLIVAEPQLAHEILMKNFSHFSDRVGLVLADKPLGMSLVFAEYQNWKKSGTVVAKTFSQTHLKQMSEVFDSEALELIAKITAHTKHDRVIPMLEYLKTSLLNTAFKALFGVKIDDSGHKPMTNFVKNILSNNLTIVQMLTFVSPLFARLFNTSVFDKQSTDYLIATIKHIIGERKKRSDSSHYDFIQYLIDAEDNEQCGGSYVDRKRLNNKEIIDNSIAFILAAFDTTTAALCHVMHCLVNNPLVYDKLSKEVDHYSSELETNHIYEVVNKMQYLDACIKEALRLWPSAATVGRCAVGNTRLSNGLVIPKNAWVCIPVYALHRDSDVFDNPDQFIPERFLPDNICRLQAGSYLSFGDGPRNRVGIRFAHLQIKVFITRLLRAFKLECDPTQQSHALEYNTGLPLMLPRKFNVKIVEK